MEAHLLLMTLDDPAPSCATPVLVLWDLATLLYPTDEIDRRLHRDAAEQVLGRPCTPAPPATDLTDPELARRTLLRQGLSATQAGALLPAVLGRLAVCHRSRGLAPAQCRARPDTVAALRMATGATGAVHTVLTGTIRPNALLRLRASGLTGLVDTGAGAYGSDDCRWERLVSIAGRRAWARDGREPPMVVVTSRPRVAEQARTAGAKVIQIAGDGRHGQHGQRAGYRGLTLPDLRTAAEVLVELPMDEWSRNLVPPRSNAG
ncbi:hypothetical protein E1264_19910 [Actinomadura sp. KC216]|uniref:hypothetical protein n=1 Tax=Actinomadura sp. KC216 TaxID=2530370 RepID=UPI0010525737|nr:hypothetical protein [Actinomadura sp. KC216]TDB85799.1 hypothetical protein E1264_19910 [Actinomadura sp. KC216]